MVLVENTKLIYEIYSIFPAWVMRSQFNPEKLWLQKKFGNIVLKYKRVIIVWRWPKGAKYIPRNTQNVCWKTQNLFCNAQNLSLKNARNLSWKNVPNVFLNTQNLSLIIHQMFPELHQTFFEMHRIFPELLHQMFFWNAKNISKNNAQNIPRIH